jgi:lipid A 3-O-deacylase
VRRLAVALLACAGLPAAAQEPARWYFRLDNDLFFGTDRWYSSGMRLARVQPHGDHEIELGLVQEIYTPEIRRYEFGVTDRAPAARLLLSAARHDRRPELFQTVEVALGVRGPAALGRPVTEFIHRIVPARDIVWSRQEPNRFDGLVAAVRSHQWDPIAVHYGAVLGNEVAFAHVGGELRAGARGASTAVLRHAATPPGGAGASPGWSGFVGASVRGVARNEMLRRQYTAFAPELKRRNTVVRGAAGVAWSRPGMELAFALVHESREFDGQRAPQRFGSLALQAAF